MSLMRLGLLAGMLTATQAQLTFQSAQFFDPINFPYETTLTLYVEANCPANVVPSNVQVTVYFPAGAFLGTGFTTEAFLGDPSSQGCDLAFNPTDNTGPAGTAQSLTFSNFDYAVLVAGGPLAGFTSLACDLDTSDSNGVPNTLGQLLQLGTGFSFGGTQAQTDFVASYTGQATTCKGPSGLNGDPQFAGFQGQNFQFHGMADEVFSLISTPTFQMNGNFKYLSSGKCSYNETACYSHPGTYVDQLGFSIGDVNVQAVAGPHESGLRLWMNGVEVHHAQTAINSKIIFSIFNTSESGVLTYTTVGRFSIDVPQFTIEVTNSDYFFNLEVSLKDSTVLRSGAKKTNLHKKFLCSSSGVKSDDRLRMVEDEMAQHYPRIPMHGLIGQTWRNSVICDHAWVGDASDYVTSGIFAHDSAFNYYLTQP